MNDKFEELVRNMVKTKAKLKMEYKYVKYSLIVLVLMLFLIDISQYLWFPSYDLRKWKCGMNLVYLTFFLCRHFRLAYKWGNSVLQVEMENMAVTFDYNVVMSILVQVLTSVTFYCVINFVSCLIQIIWQNTEYVISAIFLCLEYSMYALDWNTNTVGEPSRPMRNDYCSGIDKFMRENFGSNLVKIQVKDQETANAAIRIHELAVEHQAFDDNDNNKADKPQRLKQRSPYI